MADLRTRVKVKLMDDSREGWPPISQKAAFLAVAGFAVAYVAPFYLVPSLRLSASVSRNSAGSIRARSQAVALVCAACLGVSLVGQSVRGIATPAEVLHRAGLYPVAAWDTLRTLALLCVLFAGPLYERGVVADGGGNARWWRVWVLQQPRALRAELWDDWLGWRNLVVGPVSEELIFRSLTVGLLLAAWTPAASIVWRAPLLFGVAHLHHLVEFVATHKRPDQSFVSALCTPRVIVPGVLRALFQLSFTTVFGMFVTFVLLRTGNVYSCVLAHTFCNWMGLPRVWGRVGEETDEDEMSSGTKHSSGGQEMDEFDGVSVAHEGPSAANGHGVHVAGGLGLHWTVIYYVLLFGGAYGFKRLLWPLTSSDNALVYL